MSRDYFAGEKLVDRGRRARLARLQRWFDLAVESEQLRQAALKSTSRAALRRHDRFMAQHPNAGLITAAFLYDVFLVATERNQ